MSRNEAWLADLILQDTSILAYGRVKGLSKAAALVAAERVDAERAIRIIKIHEQMDALCKELSEASTGLSPEARQGLQIMAEEGSVSPTKP